MPIEPLFVADDTNTISRDELVRRLRLTKAFDDGAQAHIDQAIQETRIWFYDDVEGIGAAQVTKILGIPYVENPTTADELLRVRASLMEVEKVRCILLCKLPVLFMDGSGVSLEAWNEEPLTRNSFAEIQEMIRKCEEFIESTLPALKEEPCEQGIVEVSVFGPPCPRPVCCPTPRPGGSLRINPSNSVPSFEQGGPNLPGCC